MVKIAQHTKFDDIMQRDQKRPNTWHAPKQRILFPDPNKPGYYGDSGKEEAVGVDEEPYEHLNYEYPEVGPENIKTNLTEGFNPTQNEWGQAVSKKPLDETTLGDPEKLSEATKKIILSRYNRLRQIAAKFYACYQEANLLAETNVNIPLGETYRDLFSNYGKIITAKLTQEIGRLFGTGTGRRYYEDSIKYTLKDGLNIFNITSANYNTKMREMEVIITKLTNIVNTYERRKKLLKYIGPKVQEAIDVVMENEEWQKFFAWMDEYFPGRKEEIIQNSMQTLARGGYNRGDAISFNDLISFKTFKQVYEKAQFSSTKALKNTIEYDITKDVQEAAKEQIYGRVTRLFISIAEFITAIHKDSSLSLEEQCMQVISFLRKKNIDLRSIFTFSLNANQKQLTEYYKSSSNPEDQANVEDLVKKDMAGFYYNFIKQTLYFVDNFLKEKDGMWSAKWGLSGAVDEAVTKMFGGRFGEINRETYSKALQLNSKDFERLASQFVSTYMLKSINGLDSEYNHHRETLRSKSPTLGGIGKVMRASDGKFSIEAFTNYAMAAVPSLPQNIIFAAVKAMFRELDYKSLNNISGLGDPSLEEGLKLIVHILGKDNKLDPNNFYKMFKNISNYAIVYRDLRSNLPKSFTADDLFQTMIDSIRSHQTIDRDLDNLVIFAKFIHNEAGGLPDPIVRKIIKNKNFVNFNKVGIVKKLFKCYTLIQTNGGAKGIYEKYGKLITALRQKNYISPQFRNNLLDVTRFFESNEEISPASPLFAKLFETASKIESDLGILEMGDALKDLLKNYKPKSPNLFDLDYSVRNDLRFRVLRDKDPRILRIGIETDCCQRLGGVGEIAARDSFMNPLSSVLVLEWLDPRDNEWKLLTQSYFHYVPEDNGYILDNVEHNRKNVQEFKDKNPDLSLEDVYAVYAQEIKNKLDVNYFLSGKSYSKIDSYKFQTDARDKDPRFLDDRALTRQNTDHYSDYDEHSSMDLLSPNFNIEMARDKVFAPEIKKAQLELRRFIKAILNHRGLFKTAQQSSQDIKTLQGVKANLFGPQSWIYINQFMNELNNDLFALGGTQKLGNQTINFETVVKNPTGQTRFTGGMKSLFTISTQLWGTVTANRNAVYSVDEAKGIANELLSTTNNSNFPEPTAQSIKPKLVSILNNWLAILK